MSEKKKLLWQLAGFIFVLGIGIVSIVSILNKSSVSQVQGTYIERKAAARLISEVVAVDEQDELAELLVNLLEKKGNLTYADYEAILTLWMKRTDTLKKIGTKQLEDLSQKYKKNHAILQEDFFEFYFQAADLLAPEKELKREELFLLAGGEKVLDPDKEPLKEGTVFATDSELQTVRVMEYDAADKEMSRLLAVTSKERVLYVFEKEPLTATLKKAWIQSNLPESLSIVWKGYELTFSKDGLAYEQRQVIGDIAILDGKLSEITPYNEKVTGKLLSIHDNQIELEGYEKFHYGEDIQVYKLYGESEEYDLSDLKIGYAFTDFVLDGNEVVAALVTQEENMEKIRVVIKTTGFAGAYHDEITFSADTSFTIKSQGYEKNYEPGERVTVSKDSSLFTADRISIVPDALTARITIYSIERGQGIPAYRGTMEIEKTEKGLLLINELLLEEYLYSVVPSEMPSSYPKEALKAQAVSARSYAYKHMQKSGLQSYGAHVDDSAAYQVYNNVAESESALNAVRETSGQLVLRNGKVADTYFYSTSCGFGTDILAWKSSVGDDELHLKARKIENSSQAEAQGENSTAGQAVLTPEDMQDEETFRAYIQSVGEDDFEKDEGWYRWSYKTTLDSERMREQLKARYQAKPEQILTRCKDGTFVSKEIGELGNITNISVLKRSSGGAILELLIEGTKGAYMVISEHNVRYVLANEGNEVVRKTGDTVTIAGMLPSAFAIIVPQGRERIESYVVIGGGFGHGIGMSQNGAKAMGNEGYTYEEILKFFYDGITVSQ